MTDNPNTLSERYERLQEENRDLREMLEKITDEYADLLYDAESLYDTMPANPNRKTYYFNSENVMLKEYQEYLKENHENER